MTCQNCQGAAVYARSLCRACYVFERRHHRLPDELDLVRRAMRDLERQGWQRQITEFRLAQNL